MHSFLVVTRLKTPKYEQLDSIQTNDNALYITLVEHN